MGAVGISVMVGTLANGDIRITGGSKVMVTLADMALAVAVVMVKIGGVYVVVVGISK